jgi:hypothetical protein
VQSGVVHCGVLLFFWSRISNRQVVLHEVRHVCTPVFVSAVLPSDVSIALGRGAVLQTFLPVVSEPLLVPFGELCQPIDQSERQRFVQRVNSVIV